MQKGCRLHGSSLLNQSLQLWKYHKVILGGKEYFHSVKGPRGQIFILDFGSSVSSEQPFGRNLGVTSSGVIFLELYVYLINSQIHRTLRSASTII
jgi:hypothetical protein